MLTRTIHLLANSVHLPWRTSNCTHNINRAHANTQARASCTLCVSQSHSLCLKHLFFPTPGPIYQPTSSFCRSAASFSSFFFCLTLSKPSAALSTICWFFACLAAASARACFWRAASSCLRASSSCLRAASSSCLRAASSCLRAASSSWRFRALQGARRQARNTQEDTTKSDAAAACPNLSWCMDCGAWALGCCSGMEEVQLRVLLWDGVGAS